MIDPARVAHRCRGYALQLCVLIFVYSCLFIPIFYIPALKGLRTPSALSTPLAAMYGIVLAVRLRRCGVGNLPFIPLPFIPMITGAAFLIGGVALNLGILLTKAPHLPREASIAAYTLIAAGYSRAFAYAFAFTGQALYGIFACLLWLAFLQHARTIVILAHQSCPKSYLDFVKAATGGAELSWRQYMCPFKMSEMPSAYFMLWPIASPIVVSSLNHWYWGLEWLHVAPRISYNMLVSIWYIVLTVLYGIWLWYEYRYGATSAASVRP